jgi:thiosulfate/3-mercaptopyruvate sulfurtransferase
MKSCWPIFLVRQPAYRGDFMKKLFGALVVSLGLVSGVSANSYGPLVEAKTLFESTQSVQPVLLDIRNKGYNEQHILGAISAPYQIFRGSKENPGGVVDVETLEVSLEKLGLVQDQPIVIITDGKTNSDFGAAARVYWTLKSTGFSDLSILNGGYASWLAASLPTSTEAKTISPSELELTYNQSWMASTDDVANVVKGNNSAVLVDARLPAFYAGDKAHPASKKPGTLPGAINHSFTSFFDKDAPAISKISDIGALKTQLGISSDKEDVISFCNTGHWAATHWFAVSELAGVENAKLYPGSMVEYSNADLPMENTPGFIKNLVKQITR